MRVRGWVFMAVAVLVTWATPGSARELVVFNWSEYLDPDAVAAFEAEFDASVRVVHYGDDGHRDRLMAETDGAGFDVILVDGRQVDVYRQRGWIRRIERDQVPNRRHLDERWLDAQASTRAYGVPYFWGTIGIAYRRDLVTAPLTSWRQFYAPRDDLSGRIVMPGVARDVLGMALKAGGDSVNTDRTEAWIEAGERVLAQSEHVASYSYISLGPDSRLVDGTAVAAMVYGGDALNVAQHHDAIEYVLPDEGGAIWCDYLTVAARSDDPALAHAFIDFLNRPAIAAQQAEYLYMATPNRAARERLPAELLENPVIYPDADALARSEFYRPLEPEILRLQSRIFAQIRH